MTKHLSEATGHRPSVTGARWNHVRGRFARLWAAGLVLVTCVSLPQAACSQTTPAKPLLSKEIRTVFEKSGSEAAQKRYNEIVARQAGAYEFDVKGMMDLGTEYAKAGDMTAAQVFFAMGSEMSIAQLQRLHATQQNSEVLRQLNATLDSADREAEKVVAATPKLPDLGFRGSKGVARDDLDRFAGVYGDPAKQQPSPRNFFIYACKGFLRFGAMWGDVAPYAMRSTGTLTFEQAWLESFEKEGVKLEFHVDASGKATAITHTFTFGAAAQRVPRLGGLPKEWTTGDCR